MNSIQKNAGGIISQTNQIYGTTMFASAAGGEMFFTHTMSSAGETMHPSLTPLKYLLGEVRRFFKGLKEVGKDKRKLIPIIVLSAIWMVVTVIPMLGINSSLVKFLNFLTFAQGGRGAGIPGIIGGAIGKGVFSYFVFTLVIPLFSGKNPFSGIGGGVRTFFSSFAVKGIKSLIPQLFAGGTAMIAYNFLAGSASLENSMVGIAAFVISIKSLSAKTGFLKGFLIVAASKSTKGKSYGPSNINRIIAGWGAGFALAVALSASSKAFVCYVAGAVTVIVAVVLFIASKIKGKAVA